MEGMEHIPLKFCHCYHQLSECLLAADFKLYLMTSLLKSFSDATTVRTLGGDGDLETSANCHKNQTATKSLARTKTH